MYAVALVIILALPNQSKPVIYQAEMSSIMECVVTVFEMTSKAPSQLKNGGQLEVACIVNVPKSENP